MAPTEAAPTADNTIKMEKKETPYGKQIVATIKPHSHFIFPFRKKKKKKKKSENNLEKKSIHMKTIKRLFFPEKKSVKEQYLVKENKRKKRIRDNEIKRNQTKLKWQW